MKHFGYWVFGKDMTNVKPKTLKDNGITDLFLNYYAFTAHGKTKVLAFIKECKTYKIDVHIWVQCFYDGEWHNPKTTDLTAKLKEIKKYAAMENVKGVHLDYLRYPGNAYKTDGGADAITAFVKKVRSQNPSTFLSCAIMPESENKKYYGQDITALGKIVDAVLPMQYKGNYGQGTSWLTSTTKQFSKDATIWSGLQTYKSDDDTTQLTTKELLNDTKTCINAGAKGAVLFRYGICPTVNFTTLQDKTTTTTTTAKKVRTYKEIVTIAQNIKKNVEKKYKLGVNPAWVYYICKAVMKVNTDFPRIGTIKEPGNPRGDHISNQIFKHEYFDMAKRLIKFTEEKKVLPNFIKITLPANGKTYRVRARDYIYMFSRILVYYDKNGKFPKYANVNSKCFTKPTESDNEVYAYFKKVFGDFGDTIDGALSKIAGNAYGYYYDDVYSNKTSIDRMADGDGVNCTDSCQVFYNIMEALIQKGKYKKVECLHIGCSGGDGHVRLRITLNDGDYIYRDPAAVLSSGSITYNWCSDGELWAINPSWFLDNLRR